MTLRVLTWNLFHGRSKPEARRSLLPEFSAMLAGWEWDVALLQEVPPWWPEPLARASGASMRMALTSRNLLPPLQRLIADRRPDLLKSGAGGSHAILLGGDLNLRGAPTAFGFAHLAGHFVDHVLGRGLEVVEAGRTLDRGALSDHAPVTVVVGSAPE